MGYQSVPDYELVDEPFRIEPLVASELIAEAMRRRPELRSLNLRAEAAGRFASAEKALRYPSVSLIGSAGLVPGGSSALRSNYAAAGVNITLPFLNGGLLRAREAEAELRARGAREQARELETRIVRDIQVALLNVNTAAEQVGLTARLYDQATKAAELAQARYDLGLSSIVELSQAQLSQTSALIQNTNAKYNYQTHRAVLDFHIGARP
jgi:outer membrane protein